MPGMRRPGILLPGGRELPVPGQTIQYPLVVEQILHAAGVNCVPMEDGAVMLRFPSTNGFCVSIPLSAQGCDELVAKLAEAKAAGQQVDPDASVDGPSNDQPPAGPGETE